MTLSVRHTAELDRILRLPRRLQGEADAHVLEMSEALRAAGGTQTLLPVQALALLEAMLHGGLVGNIDVGEGKTLITFLIAYVLEAERYLLLLPASLIDKTKREHEKYAKHWNVTPLEKIKLLSYDILGRAKYEKAIEEFDPDLIGADEAHRLKDRMASSTRRVIRHMKKKPETRFVALSATFIQRSVRDCGHIVRWCLKDKAPVPRTEAELEDWAWALDDKLPEEARWHPGALLKFCNADEVKLSEREPLSAARLGFQRRLLETPGVVSSLGENRISSSLYVSPVRPTYKPITEENFTRLRSKWETPDGWPLMSGAEVWRHARELALGFYYVWDPRPPQPWLAARRDWSSFVREIVSRSHKLDSEDHVAQAIDDGRVSDGGLLARWRKVQPTFRVNQKAIWFDESALELCAQWMEKGPGIVWTEHVHFAERLAVMTGRKYYGAEGRSPDGELIDDAKPGPIIASIKANKAGRNLQEKWSRNFVVAPPDTADDWHQLIGRTHRRGQTSEEVTVEILLGCREHASAFRHAMSGAAATRDMLGMKHKLHIADIEWPSEDDLRRLRGPRWERVLYASHP